MRRIGTAVRIAQGSIVVRSPDDTHPAIGVTVVDERLDPVGRVVDVIGPVDRPYVVVHPTGEGSPTTLLDAKLYVR